MGASILHMHHLQLYVAADSVVLAPHLIQLQLDAMRTHNTVPAMLPCNDRLGTLMFAVSVCADGL